MAKNHQGGATSSHSDALLGDGLDDEKKRRLFWSLVWLIFALAVVLPLTSFLAPIWLLLQLVEAFIPVGTWL